MSLATVSGYNIGDEIACGIEWFNTTKYSGAPTGGSGTATDTSYGPRCIIASDPDDILTQSNLLIRIEWIATFAAGGVLSLAIDQITLPNYLSATNKQILYPVSAKVRCCFIHIKNYFQIKELFHIKFSVKKLKIKNIFNSCASQHQALAASALQRTFLH